MKIGLVTIFDVPNYGSVLQAFATKKVLELLGNDVSTINYTRKNKWWKSKSECSGGFSLKNLIHKCLITHYGRLVHHLDKFRTAHLGFTGKFDSLEELKEADWNKYQMLVTGSDQVWNSNYLYGDSVYMLSFAPESIRKVAIAASFAQKVLSDDYVSKYQKYLSQYAALSVREQNGKDIIEKQLGLAKEVKVLLDPTLLLSASEWTRCFELSYSLPPKYILLYMLDYAFEPKPFIYNVVRHFKRTLNCPVLALAGYKRPCKAAELKMQNVGDSTIEKFIDLFHHATLVVTSSFHGTAFAVNFGKPLVSVVPDGGDDRQTSLLAQLGLMNCAVKVGSAIDGINPFYDVEQEQSRLEQLRKDSISWLKKNVNNNDYE